MQSLINQINWSCNNAVLACSLVGNKSEFPLVIFFTASTTFASGRVWRIFCMAVSFGNMCVLSLSSESEIRIVSSEAWVEGVGDLGRVGGSRVAN